MLCVGDGARFRFGASAITKATFFPCLGLVGAHGSANFDLPVLDQQHQGPQACVNGCIVPQQFGVDDSQAVVDCDVNLGA